MREAEGHADAPAYANPPPPLTEPPDHDRERHTRRYDALPSGAGRDPPRAGSARYPPAHPASAREAHRAPTQRLARSSSREREAFAFDRGGGARGGDPFARTTDRDGLFPRPDARCVRSGASRWSRAPAPAAPPREGDPHAEPDPARENATEPASGPEVQNRELVLYGFPGDATHLDVRRALETCGVPLARVHAFTDRLYVCPTYSAIRDVPGAKCVAAYARALTDHDARRVLEHVNSGVDGAPLRFRDAPLAAMRWDAPRPGVLKGIPRAPPPEAGGLEVTRRFLAEPAKSRARAPETSAPAGAAARAPAPASMPHPEWLGPNRCAVHACGQMGRLIGPQGACVIGMKKETGCQMSKLDDERMVVEGATQTLVERGVERVRREVSKWLREVGADERASAGATRSGSRTAKHPIVPWRPNLTAVDPLNESVRGRDTVPTPAFAERRGAGAASAPVSAASAKSRASADALSADGEEPGEMSVSGRAEGKRTSNDADARVTDDERAEALARSDEAARSKPAHDGAGDHPYDSVADFSDCLPPGEKKAGVRETGRAAAAEDPEPNPEPNLVVSVTPGPTRVTAPTPPGADDAQPPPPPPPPASPPAVAEPAEEDAKAPAPPAPPTTFPAASPPDEVSPRERLLSLVATRQIPRDTIERCIEDALDPTRAPDPDPAPRLSPEAEVSREARNLFVRHKVPPRLAESGYRVSMVLRAAPDASAREKTRAKSWDWRLAQDWTLALDEGDEAPTGREPVDTRVQPGDAPGGEPRGRRLAPQAAETFASRVSNAAAAEAEVDAWVARRFGGDCAKALAAIEAVPFTATALKRQAPNPERLSKTQAAKKKRGGSS